MRRHLLPLLALAAALGGCGFAGSGPSPEVDEGERRVGAEQHPMLLSQFGGEYEGPESAYLKGVGERIAAQAGLEGECTFTLVNTDVVNAFAVPGCYIYVTRGMMGIVNSEDELASVLGHEVGHIVADHSKQQQNRSLLRQLGVLAVAVATESETLTRIAGGAAELFTLRYSRKHEHESDDYAIRYLKGAGYDPYAAADMLDALGRHEAFQRGDAGANVHAIPEWGRTHPLTENRIERVRAAAEATGAAPDAVAEQEARFLAEVDGLLYGDDPRQGFVLGRRFAHPGMRIGFEVPEGYALTNTPQAVLIAGPDGVRGEFGGGRMPAGGLEAYADALVEKVFGARGGRAQRTEVNGVPAVVMPLALRTEQGNVEALVAAYEGAGGAAYHFLLVSPPGQAMPRSAQALAGSFRRISPEEAAGLRPRAIEVVTVRPGETLETMAARMASERPREHFLTLNGRTEDDPLRPGERVKLIRFAALR